MTRIHENGMITVIPAEKDYDEFTIEPKIGYWVTMCCECDAEELKTEADLIEYLSRPKDEVTGRRLYWESGRCFRSLTDLLANEGYEGEELEEMVIATTAQARRSE